MPTQTFDPTDPRYVSALSAVQQQRPEQPVPYSERILALADMLGNANPARGLATFGARLPLNPGGSIQKAFLGLNYDTSLLQKLNDMIASRTDYGRRLESGKPGQVLSWSNSAANWLPQTADKADTVESLLARSPHMASYLWQSLRPAKEKAFGNQHLKSLLTGSRLLDANQVFVPRQSGATKKMLEAVAPWLDQLPLYSSGPLGGSFENKMKRLQSMRELGGQ